MAKTATASNTADTTEREDLVLRVQKALDLPSKAAAKRTVDAVLGQLAEQLSENGTTAKWDFRVHELATFKVSPVGARNRKNPRTGEIFAVPAHTKLSVKLAKSLRDLGKPAKK
jgi:nucleoid DNA-binding protein